MKRLKCWENWLWSENPARKATCATHPMLQDPPIARCAPMLGILSERYVSFNIKIPFVSKKSEVMLGCFGDSYG